MRIEKWKIWREPDYADPGKTRGAKIYYFLLVIIILASASGMLEWQVQPDWLGEVEEVVMAEETETESQEEEEMPVEIRGPVAGNPDGFEEIILPTGKREVKRDLDLIEWLVYNSQIGFLSSSAVDWISPYFGCVSYRYFGQEAHRMDRPRFEADNQSNFGFVRQCVDGTSLFVRFPETAFAFMPHVDGLSWSQDLGKRILSQEVISTFLWKFSNFCRKDERGYMRWDKDQVTDWVVFQYASAYGIFLDSTKISVEEGDSGGMAVFYDGELPKVRIRVYEYDRDKYYYQGLKDLDPVEKEVALIDEIGQLLFYPSVDPTQALFLGRSSLKPADGSSLATVKQFDIRWQDFYLTLNYASIKREWRKVREVVAREPASFMRSNDLGEYDSFANPFPYVVQDDLYLQRVAKTIIGDKKKRDDQIMRLARFVRRQRAIQDNKGQDGKSGEVQMPFWTFIANGGGDCDDHAIAFASLVAAASCISDNQVALSVLHGSGSFHMIPLITGDWEKKDSPLMNYLINPDDEKPYFWVEVTSPNSIELGEYFPGEQGYDLVAFRQIGKRTKWYDPADLEQGD
ncbi:hypothetical protein ACFL2B_00395 [Patescibacteria group bacterium]